MVKIPYGTSSFKALVTNGAYYVDRTPYIERIEQSNANYLFFLRPRRFGKSLFVSTLKHYYGIEYKDEFQTLFGQYYIGKNPTPKANSCLVLTFDFSGIQAMDSASIQQAFYEKVLQQAKQFIYHYSPTYFSDEDTSSLVNASSVAGIIGNLFVLISWKARNIPVYLLIDEYDNFANKFLANSDMFLSIVGQNSFFRSFFEEIKIWTQSVINRIFITGVSPLTLDGFTSGFNITSDISTEPLFHDMLGFKKQEVQQILSYIGVPHAEQETTMSDMKFWYNGYTFSPEIVDPLYNPDMVLYFANHYATYKRYPRKLLDTNIASDSKKLLDLLKLGNQEEAHFQVIKTILDEGTFQADLTEKFNFERRFTVDDFVSLLYYMGMLTLKGSFLDLLVFGIPNHVIQVLYFDLFRDLIAKKTNYYISSRDITNSLYQLSQRNNVRPLLNMAERVLSGLSNRDSIQFNEKHIKTLLFTLIFGTRIYYVRSEYEVARKYIDLFLEGRRDAEVKYQFVFELKYLSKANEKKLEEVKAEAIAQLRGYMAHESLAKLSDLVGYVIIFVGTEAKVVEKLL